MSLTFRCETYISSLAQPAVPVGSGQQPHRVRGVSRHDGGQQEDTLNYFSYLEIFSEQVSRSYTGDYVCTADNGVGRWPVRKIITLDVLCK